MGCKRNRRYIDTILTLRQLERNIEFNRNTYIIFVDQKIHFFRVDIEATWKIKA